MLYTGALCCQWHRIYCRGFRDSTKKQEVPRPFHTTVCVEGLNRFCIITIYNSFCCKEPKFDQDLDLDMTYKVRAQHIEETMP